jgi:hypothetical protein
MASRMADFRTAVWLKTMPGITTAQHRYLRMGAAEEAAELYSKYRQMDMKEPSIGSPQATAIHTQA